MEELGENDLVASLESAATLACPFEAVTFRSCSPRYANEPDLLRGEGSRRFGGRWNPVGVAMLYTSLTPEVAMAETLAHHRYYGLPIEGVMPRVFVAIEVRLQVVLDLRVPMVLRRLGLRPRSLVKVDWRRDVRAGRRPLSQSIGASLRGAGFEGMVVPSAALAGHNLVLLPDGLATGSSVRICTKGL